MLLEGGEPAGARRDGGAGVALRVGLQGPGQPGHAPGQRRSVAAGPRGVLEVLISHRYVPPAEGDTPGEKVRLHRLGGLGRLEAGGDLLGVAEQTGGMLAVGVPGLGENQAGASLPEGPHLRPELSGRLTCQLPGIGYVARG